MLTFSLMDILGLVIARINEQGRPSGKSPPCIIFPRQLVFIRAAREGIEGMTGGSKKKSRKKTISLILIVKIHSTIHEHYLMFRLWCNVFNSLEKQRSQIYYNTLVEYFSFYSACLVLLFENQATTIISS